LLHLLILILDPQDCFRVGGAAVDKPVQHPFGVARNMLIVQRILYASRS